MKYEAIFVNLSLVLLFNETPFSCSFANSSYFMGVYFGVSEVVSFHGCDSICFILLLSLSTFDGKEASQK